MFEILGLHHVNVIVQDVEVSKRFYCDVLGMEDVPRHPSFTFPGAWLRSGSAEVHLIQEDAATHAPGDLSYAIAATTDMDLGRSRHFCLEIDDTDSLVRHLEAQGVEVAYGPIKRLGGLVQTYCYDPDRHLVEFSEFGRDS